MDCLCPYERLVMVILMVCDACNVYLRGYHIRRRKEKKYKKNFAECHEQDTRQKCIFWAPGRRVCRVSGTLHSANREALPSAWASALGKQAVFAECLVVTTLGKVTVTVILPCHLFFFCRGPSRHSAKCLPSAG